LEGWSVLAVAGYYCPRIRVGWGEARRSMVKLLIINILM
jgi:hypothetical protein